MNKNKLYENIIQRFGKSKQLLILFEEMGELTQAISKYERGVSVNTKNIQEELADVYIMLGQVRIMYGIDSEKLDLQFTEKLFKLKKILESRVNQK